MTDTDFRVYTSWKIDPDKLEPDPPKEPASRRRSIQFGMDGMPMGPWNNHIKCSCGEPVR